MLSLLDLEQSLEVPLKSFSAPLRPVFVAHALVGMEKTSNCKKFFSVKEKPWLLNPGFFIEPYQTLLKIPGPLHKAFFVFNDDFLAVEINQALIFKLGQMTR